MCSRSPPNRYGVFVAAFLLATAPTVHAQPANADTWTGASTTPLTAPNANWQDGGNWSSGVPTSSNTAYFNGAGGGFTSISLGGTPPSIAAIQFDTAAVASYTIGTGGTSDTLTIASNNISSTVGAISVTSAVTNPQAINSNITFTTTAPLITNVSTTPAAVLTLGSGSAATITPASGTTGLTMAVTNGATIAVNSSITGAMGGTSTGTNGTTVTGGLQLQLLTGGSPTTGTIAFNSSQSTYSGFTNFNSTTGSLTVQIGASSNAGGTAGPFGTSTLYYNGNGTQSFIQAVGAAQTIANPFVFVAGETFNANATPQNLTFTGNGQFISNSSRTVTFTNATTTPYTVTFGATPNSSTFALSSTTISNCAFDVPVNMTLVLNSTITNTGSVTDTVSYNSAGNNTPQGTVLITGANTYPGTTTFNGQTSGTTVVAQIIEIGSSSMGGNVTTGLPTSGPFGQGTVIPVVSTTFSTAAPAILEPYGANITVANAISLASGGFFVANVPGTSYNLTFSGPITMTTAGKVLTNNMTAGAALNFGVAGSASTITLGTTAGQTLKFQSQSAAPGAGTTIINDVIQNASGGAAGSIVVQTGGTVQLTNANTYSGSTSVTGGTLLASNTSAGGSATGTSTVSVTGTGTTATPAVGNGGTLGGAGTITGAITISSFTSGGFGGVVSPGPGNSVPGTLNVGSMTWNRYGQYTFLHDATNSNAPNGASPGMNDLILGSGTLNLGDLSNAPFNINLVPVNFSSTPTQMTYTLATFSGGIIGPAGAYPTGTTDVSALFTVTGAYTNIPSTMYAAVTGTTGGPQSLTLTFSPVPEPTCILAACGGLTALAAWRRRSRKRL